MTVKSYFEKLESKFGPLTFASMLRSLRESEAQSQSNFAKHIGISPQILNDLEKGKRIPSPSRAAKIAKKLGLPLEGVIELSLRDALKKEGLIYDVKLIAA